VRLALAHARAEVLELVRYPTYSAPTLAFPAIMYLVFGASAAEEDAARVMASFAAFGVLTVVFFQFGVGVALTRVSAWEVYLRTLPLAPRTRLAGGLLAAAPFAAGSAGAVVLVALVANPPQLSPGAWLRLLVALVVGGTTLAALGLALGYWARPRAALPLANLLNLGLAFAGGLWFQPQDLPSAVESVSPYLPTRQWGDLIWSVTESEPWRLETFAWLAAYTLAFLTVAIAGYRRNEEERYR
jgi:ABC-2 type transport system permease protein